MEQIRSGPMAGRTVLVTGGSAGIGRATALGLAMMGAHLAITGRDSGRVDAAAGEIRAAGGGKVDVFVADLSAQSQVRRLAGEVLQSLSRIDVLVNNVGGYWHTRHVTADGLERTFAVNHLAPFLLTNLLLDRLKHSAPAQVVTVSSNAHTRGRIDFDDLQGERSYSGARAYSQSKLANLLFTYELARRLAAGTVTANAAVHEDPGPRRSHVHLPGFRSGSSGRDRPLLRQQQTQKIRQTQLRPSRGGAALAAQRDLVGLTPAKPTSEPPWTAPAAGRSKTPAGFGANPMIIDTARSGAHEPGLRRRSGQQDRRTGWLTPEDPPPLNCMASGDRLRRRWR
jgi:NAD(P)-dependent dehydrogenase (short-subunit alcohol dehydrogenase family)